ncbi:MAG TPA: hypothetical protein VK052_00240 [Zeimonas sp.]|nr:hypothetical protein [Zeimonas sp.]
MKTTGVLKGRRFSADAVDASDRSLRESVEALASALAGIGARSATTASEPAWIAADGLFDGWSCPPLPLKLIHHARAFVRMLPAGAPVPVPTTDDNGQLSFQWTGAHARHLLVVVSEDGMLVYSGRLGPRRRINGAEPLSGELPAPIRQSLYDVIG